MKRYNFSTNITEYKETGIMFLGKKNVIKYKCLICGYTHDWDDAFDDEKKAQIKSEVDKHHNEHIIPDEPTLSE